MQHAAAARHTWDWLVQRYPKRGLTPDTHLQNELGVDSLAWLNLTMELGQRTGVELDEEAIGGIETMRDLLCELVRSAAQVLPINPQHGARTSLALAASVLRRNRGLIWFPEGQRCESGELQPFRPGIGMLLDRFPATVVTVSIHGSHEAMPPGRLFPRLRRLRVHFDTPIDSRRLAEQGEGEDAAARITQAVQSQMRTLHSQATPHKRN